MSIPDYSLQLPPGFTTSSLERQGHSRSAPDELQAALDSAGVILVHRYKLPIAGRIAQLLDARQLEEELTQAIWLGNWHGRSVYALDVSARDPGDWPELRFADLRGAAMRLDPDHASVLAYARAMVYWHRQHRFCGRCGGPTQIALAGHVRRCPSCDVEHYPRTDPSMLALVCDEQDRALLARQANWPEGQWSVLAGFVEPGESIEDAVIREVWEESRIEVQDMRYFASQPWPFPASVLMGFHARARGAKPQVEQDELEVADWFSRAQLVDAMQRRELWLPPPFTLSYRLIEAWFDQAWPEPLDRIHLQSAP